MPDCYTLFPHSIRSKMNRSLSQKMDERPQWLSGTEKFSPGRVSLIGGKPDIEAGLMRFGPDPWSIRAQAEAQAAHDNESSRTELLTIAESASKADQARKAAAALMLKQAQEDADAQGASLIIPGGPRRQVAVSMYPRAPGLLARLRASTKAFQGGR